MISNYHGHTMHCKHGVGTIEEHILKAIEYGLEEVAITEHVPIKGAKLSRIDYEDFDNFMKLLESMKAKYGDQIKIWTGLECEYIPEIFEEHLKLQSEYNIDYLVLGHHFSNLTQPGHYYFETRNNQMIDEYIEYAIAGIKSGYFAFIAHPDLFLNRAKMSEYSLAKSKELLAACEEYDVPVEINGNGFRNNKGYPNIDFWKLAKTYNLRFLINSDSHAPEEIYDHGLIAAYEFAKELEIEITERLDFSANNNISK